MPTSDADRQQSLRCAAIRSGTSKSWARCLLEKVAFLKTHTFQNNHGQFRPDFTDLLSKSILLQVWQNHFTNNNFAKSILLQVEDRQQKKNFKLMIFLMVLLGNSVSFTYLVLGILFL
jgi:hypothetical protein